MAFRLTNDTLQAFATTVCHGFGLIKTFDALREYVQQDEHNDDMYVGQSLALLLPASGVGVGVGVCVCVCVSLSLSFSLSLSLSLCLCGWVGGWVGGWVWETLSPRESCFICKHVDYGRLGCMHIIPRASCCCHFGIKRFMSQIGNSFL